MKQILAVLTLAVAVASPARADEGRVLGLIIGGIIGYQIAQHQEQDQRPQPVYRREPVHQQEPIYMPLPVYQRPRPDYTPAVIIVDTPRNHTVHPQTARIYRDQCMVDGPGRHGHIYCQ